MNSRRILAVFVILSAAFLAIGWRFLSIGYFRHSYYAAIKDRQLSFQNDLISRGTIFIKDGIEGKLVIAAMLDKTHRIELIKKEVMQIDRILNLLAGIIQFDPDAVLNDFLNSDKEKIAITSEITKDQVAKIRNLGLKGVSIIADSKRVYPQGQLAAHVLGFLGFQGHDRVGQYGIEAQYENILNGETASPKQAVFGNATKAKQGGILVLTVDKNIQTFVEDIISKIYQKWDAQGASVVVQDPSSGAILAMAATPSFDPNRYSSYPTEYFTNPLTQEVFEPGSAFKPITMSSGLDTKKITPQETYTDPGIVRIGSYTIQNFNQKNFGVRTMTEVLEKSLNTGAIYVERKVGDKDFLRYVEKFGFGRKTGVDLFGEVSGDINNLYSQRPVNFATAAFGQGIAVTPLQLINAYSAIANGGKLMRPYLVEKIIYSDGGVKITKPEILGRPISEESALDLKQMLVSVVDRGFDKARIKGYDVAGKTGTAQIPDGKGGYSDEFIHDFVGFVPAYNPKFVVLLKLDKPKGIRFSSDSLSPPFAEISRFLINYFSIPPTR